jgi:hypothetical protein
MEAILRAKRFGGAALVTIDGAANRSVCRALPVRQMLTDTHGTESRLTRNL